MKTSSFAAALLLASAASAASVQDVEPAPRFEPSCADVVFQPEDPSVSKPITLTSREWVTDCVPAGRVGEGCWERPGRSERLTARLILANRPSLLPWESDVFQVCLTGPALRVEGISTAYDYRVVSDGASDGSVVLAAGAKRALPPDPRGVQALLTPGLTLAFHDQWAAYYPGEDIVLTIALMREGAFWSDETVVKKEITLPVAENYTVELAGAARKPGGIYYAAYSIRRLGGRVSSEARTPVLQTEKVSYDPD